MKMMSLRMSPEMVAELKVLAKTESRRRRANVTWAGLVREAASRTLRKAKLRQAEAAMFAGMAESAVAQG